MRRAQERISKVGRHLHYGLRDSSVEGDTEDSTASSSICRQVASGGGNSASVSITFPDGSSASLPVTRGTIPTVKLRDFGVTSFDPGLKNTAVCESAITSIDGTNGRLCYRGYDIVELVEKSTFLEVAFLLIHGNLPTVQQLDTWTSNVMRHTYLHENVVDLMKTFRYDAHPMGIVISTVASLSTLYPEANACLRGTSIFQNEHLRNKQIYRIIGKMVSIAAGAYRIRVGRPFNQPVNHLSYSELFLYMLDHLQETNYRPNKRLARVLDKLFILHADHGLNCSTAAMRHLASSKADPYTCVAGAAGALFGPLHGGANEAVVRMLEKIGSVENIDSFLADVKARKMRLMGVGHRVYKAMDPRARIIKGLAHEVFEIVGVEQPLIRIATELERRVLNDDYFQKRKLYPNVDFYSGIIYSALGLPLDYFPVVFALARTVGWLAHWCEQAKQEAHIVRPRQVYVGAPERTYVEAGQRASEGSKDKVDLDGYSTSHNTRRSLATFDEMSGSH